MIVEILKQLSLFVSCKSTSLVLRETLDSHVPCESTSLVQRRALSSFKEPFAARKAV